MSNGSESTPIYRIHPGIGIARLGDSPDEFCISPETPAALPIDCDAAGNPRLSADGKSERTITKFKDDDGRIKRQAARFQLFVYDDDHPLGRALKLGDPIKGGGNHGTLVDIQWQVYLANKKAAWYTFNARQGEHGYGADHARRNAAITDPEARQQLIIDPGARVVNATTQRTAVFDRDPCVVYAPIFPPPLQPHAIETLGGLKTDDAGRLLVLGGHGCSGTMNEGFGQPRIDTYANNDGWFDDTSDGVVMARLVMYSQEVGAYRFVDVADPAWVIVGYPAYVPEILDMITADDVIYDLGVRNFATRTDIYGVAGTFDQPQWISPTDTAALVHWKASRLDWNPSYKPWFYRDVWPILFRADEMTHLTNILEQSNFPHNQTARGNFDPTKLGMPPIVSLGALERAKIELAQKHQQGDLFVEALEPALILIDEQRKQRDGHARRLVPILADLRQRLREAVQAFAEVASGAEAPADADRYLLRWKELAVQSQQIANTPALDGSRAQAEAAPVTYEQAKATFDRVIEQVLREIKAQLEPSQAEVLPSAKGPIFGRPAERRSEDASDRNSPQSVEAAFERAVRDLRSGRLLETAYARARSEATYDFYRSYRTYVHDLLRQPSEENEFRLSGRPNKRTTGLPLMPLLAGDNPLTNDVPTKFLRLTDYQLYLLRQWANGLFINEASEGWISKPDPYQPYQAWVNRTGRDLDQGVLMNVLGGAFCPGGEVGWLIRNPSVFKEPYRIKADPAFANFPQTAAQANAGRGLISPRTYISSVNYQLSQDTDFATGLQPGDLTKQMALPWQADFNECSTQMIDVTYAQWNTIDPDSEDDAWMRLEGQVWETLWWPAHRPLQTYEVTAVENGQPQYEYLNWSRGVPQTNAGDLKMVTEWSRLGFVIRNPFLTAQQLDQPSPDVKYISVERTEEAS